MRRVCVVITARPSYSRVMTAMRAIAAHRDLELQVIASASALLPRYGEVVREIEDDGFEIDRRIYTVLEGENPTSMAKTTGFGIVELSSALQDLRPHVVMTIADRHETLATAVASSYMNIPVAHIQGGEVSGSLDERVRHAITKLSDLHFTATAKAAERVIRMGEEPSSVHITGCPSIDLTVEALQEPFDLAKESLALSGVGLPIEASQPFLIVLQHPVTDEYLESYDQVRAVLDAVHRTGMQALWFWPNVDSGSNGTARGIRQFREDNPTAPIHFEKNVPPKTFIRLLSQCAALIGNSSVGIREAEYLGTPTVNIGTRQEGRDRGCNVRDVDFNTNRIYRAICEQMSHGKFASMNLYGQGNAGDLIAKHLAEVPLGISKRLSY